MKSSEIVGKRLRVIVNEEPCHVVMDGCERLTATIEGTAERFFGMPGGPIGVVRRDDGSRVSFDAGFDIKLGKIELELLD